MSVKDVDKGYRRIKAQLMRFGRSEIEIGIHGEDGVREKDGGITLAGVAAVHEFGTLDGHVPQRSYLRATIDNNRSAYRTQAKISVRNIVGGSGADRELARMGEVVRRDVVRRIDEHIPPPLAPSTVESKSAAGYPKPTTPLVATGELRDSIKAKHKTL